MGSFGWVVAGLIIGAMLYGMGKFAPTMENLSRCWLKWAGLMVATLGVMIWLSVIYVRYTPWFYVPALLTGVTMIVMGFRSVEGSAGDSKKKNLKLLGSGLFVTGLLMALINPGWTLFFILAGGLAMTYLRFVKTGKANQIIETIEKEVINR